jgi:hypothetical protein
LPMSIETARTFWAKQRGGSLADCTLIAAHVADDDIDGGL